MQNSYNNEYASFWVRLAAYIVDSLLVSAGLLIVKAIFLCVTVMVGNEVVEKGILFHYNIKDIVYYLLEVTYFVVCTHLTGKTLGKKLFKLEVVSAEGGKPRLFDIIYRETIGRFLSSLIVGIGYILIAIDKENRGLHDMLTDTRVVIAKAKTEREPEHENTGLLL